MSSREGEKGGGVWSFPGGHVSVIWCMEDERAAKELHEVWGRGVVDVAAGGGGGGGGNGGGGGGGSGGGDSERRRRKSYNSFALLDFLGRNKDNRESIFEKGLVEMGGDEAGG